MQWGLGGVWGDFFEGLPHSRAALIGPISRYGIQSSSLPVLGIDNITRVCYASIMTNAERQRQFRIRLRILVLAHYCGGAPRCSRCSEERIMCLDLHHKNNAGNQHRKTLGHNFGGTRFYQWLKANDFPEGYDVLCANCHAIWTRTRKYKFVLDN